MNAAQTALARGLAVLTSPTQGNGETFRVKGETATFTGVLSSQQVNDSNFGRITESVLLAPASAFAARPAEGTVIVNVDTGAEHRVAFTRPAPTGFLNIVLRSE